MSESEGRQGVILPALKTAVGRPSDKRRPAFSNGRRKESTFRCFGRAADEMILLWPSGQADTLQKVAADRLICVEEGKGIVKSVSFPPK